jgi:hypothetical protein
LPPLNVSIEEINGAMKTIEEVIKMSMVEIS